MSWLDIAIILVLSLSIIYSIYRGLIKEFFSFVSLFAGYVAANKFYLTLKHILETFLPTEIPGWAVYIFIYITIILVASVMGRLLRRAMHISITLKFVDSVGGAMVGLLKGVLILSLLLLPLFSFSFSQPLLEKSVIPTYLIKSFRIMSTLTSSDLIHGYEKKMETFNKEINKRILDIGKVGSKKKLAKYRSTLINKEDISEKDRLNLEKLVKESNRK